jgi:drug/metabolite transporter (DMT)-like permease
MACLPLLPTPRPAALPRVTSPTSSASGQLKCRARLGGVAAVALIAVVLTLALAPLAYAVGGDPFGGITQTINSNAKTWAGALIVLGLLGVCIRYYFGDSDASQHMRSFLWGSIAAIAAGFGLAVYDWLQRYVAVR